MTSPAESPSTLAPRMSWLAIAVAILFGLFHAYDLFSAISNVVGLSSQIGAYNDDLKKLGADPVALPWALLIIDLALAPVVYALAFLLGRRRSIVLRALLFAIGLATVAATALSVEAMARATF